MRECGVVSVAHLLKATLSWSSSGETYCAVPTKEFARSGAREERDSTRREGEERGEREGRQGRE